MTKIVTATGLVRVEYHGQVWFDRPGYTEVVFQRLIIHHEEQFKQAVLREGSSSAERDG